MKCRKTVKFEWETHSEIVPRRSCILVFSSLRRCVLHPATEGDTMFNSPIPPDRRLHGTAELMQWQRELMANAVRLRSDSERLLAELREAISRTWELIEDSRELLAPKKVAPV